MVTILSKAIVNFFVNKKFIGNKEFDIYKYGLEILISSVLGFTVSLVVGLVFNKIYISIFFLFVFVSIRMYSGGYHATTYFKCNLWLTVTLSVVFILSEIVNIYQFLAFPINIFSVYTIFRYAPIENINKKLSEEKKTKTGNIAKIITLVWMVLSILFFLCGFANISHCITATIFAVSLLIKIELGIKKINL